MPAKRAHATAPAAINSTTLMPKCSSRIVCNPGTSPCNSQKGGTGLVQTARKCEYWGASTYISLRQKRLHLLVSITTRKRNCGQDKHSSSSLSGTFVRKLTLIFSASLFGKSENVKHCTFAHMLQNVLSLILPLVQFKIQFVLFPRLRRPNPGLHLAGANLA